MVIQGPGLEEDEAIQSLGKAVCRVFGIDAKLLANMQSCFLLKGSVTKWAAELPEVLPRTWDGSLLFIQVCLAKSFHSLKGVSGNYIFKHELRKHVFFLWRHWSVIMNKTQKVTEKCLWFILFHAKEKCYYFQLFKDLLQNTKKEYYTFWSVVINWHIPPQLQAPWWPISGHVALPRSLQSHRDSLVWHEQ